MKINEKTHEYGVVSLFSIHLINLYFFFKLMRIKRDLENIYLKSKFNANSIEDDEVKNNITLKPSNYYTTLIKIKKKIIT